MYFLIFLVQGFVLNYITPEPLNLHPNPYNDPQVVLSLTQYSINKEKLPRVVLLSQDFKLIISRV